MTTATITHSDDPVVAAGGRFSWSAVVAGSILAGAVTFFLIVLGAGVGLAFVTPGRAGAAGATTFFTLGAIYFFASQAFGLAAGGHLVGRLIGPALENTRQEEFRAGAHGLVMWGLGVVASLMIVGLSSVVAGATLSAGVVAVQAASRPAASTNGYWLDLLFRPAANSAVVAADQAEAGRIIAFDMASAGGSNDVDTARIAHLVATDAGLSMPAAMARVADVQARMRADAVRTAAAARRTAMMLSLWTALSLLFGAVVAVAAAISARWEDDRISFSLAPRYRI